MKAKIVKVRKTKYEIRDLSGVRLFATTFRKDKAIMLSRQINRQVDTIIWVRRIDTNKVIKKITVLR